MRHPVHFRLAEAPAASVRVLAGDAVADNALAGPTWVTITRTGSFTDPRYGRFEITPAMLAEMVGNFNAGATGQDVFLDVSHRPDEGAAARLLQLKVEGDRLRALVEWTPYGIEAVRQRGYRYLSAEFHERYVDNEAGKTWGCVLLGAGLTTRPVIKRLDPVQLSEFSAGCVFVADDYLKTLATEVSMKWAALLKALREQLQAKQLSESATNAILKAATEALQALNDEASAKALCDQLAASADSLVAQANGAPMVIHLSTTPAVDVTAEVTRLLAQREQETRQLAETLASRQKLLADTINTATALDEATRRQLCEAARPLVTAAMSEEQVKALAQLQIEQGKQLDIARQLSAMGYPVAGRVQVEVPNEGMKKLTQIYHDHLRQTDQFRGGQLKLAEKVSPFVDKVLHCFDQLNAQQIQNEVKRLAGGETNMGSTALPVGFVREVIRESLSDLNILQLVSAQTDFTATETTLIPYEMRDVSQIVNDGVVFEGQPIPYASISQRNDSAFITPMKVAYLITNEVMHFSRASAINWDAMARNIESCARVMREMICRRLANELQRSADAYNAVDVAAESITSQLDGSTKFMVKTQHFPIVRAFTPRKLDGSAVGPTENPITVTLNGVTIQPFDGTGKQTTGTYYRVINYNLGYVQFVNQLGSPVCPPNTGSNTISYSRATNVVKVDLDVPSGSSLEKQLNQALQKFGAQKAMLAGSRYVQANFCLMSPTLNDTLSNAEQFVFSQQRSGSGTDAVGDLAQIKGVPAYGTNAPGIDLGDQRILLGESRQLGYTVTKPFALGEPFEAVGPDGRPIGKKQAYGEEYSAIKLPTPVRNRMTSLLVYSFTTR